LSLSSSSITLFYESTNAFKHPIDKSILLIFEASYCARTLDTTYFSKLLKSALFTAFMLKVLLFMDLLSIARCFN